MWTQIFWPYDNLDLSSYQQNLFLGVFNCSIKYWFIKLKIIKNVKTLNLVGCFILHISHHGHIRGYV